MLNDLGTLTLLGESADWLKDSSSVSIRDRRLAVVEAFRAAWTQPENEAQHEALRMAAVPLFDALRHNHLYPDECLLDTKAEGPAMYLPSPANARRDLDRLRDMIVVNKFGIGEVHLLYVGYLLCRALHIEEVPYDLVLEQRTGDIIFLREPVFRADNLGAFSSEIKARFHTVRLLRCMKAVGLFDDRRIGRISVEAQSETIQTLADELTIQAADYVQPQHHLPFVVLDTATALEAFGRAHAASRAPTDDRTPKDLFRRLRRHVRRLERHEEIGADRKQRLLNLSIAATVRAMAHVENELAMKMYTFLRSSRHKQRVHHSRMFKLLPNTPERLRFINFLYLNADRNPMYYVKRFQEHFEEGTLRFVNKSVGFTLEGEGATT